MSLLKACAMYSARALIESGFDYVSDCDGFKLFRKRK